MPTMRDNIENWFTYHAPTPEQCGQYEGIRDAAKQFAFVIDQNCPDGADKSAAMRTLRECVMTANASIACDTSATVSKPVPIASRP